MKFDEQSKYKFGWGEDEVTIYARNKEEANQAMAKLLAHGVGTDECSQLHTVWMIGEATNGKDHLLVLVPYTTQ